MSFGLRVSKLIMFIRSF